MEGQWQLAESLLHKIPFLSSSPQNVLPKVLFLIRQQKFLELLEKNETMQALQVLRSEITPLGQNTDRLHQLTSLVLCSSIEDVMKQAQWDGTQGTSREKLLAQVQRKTFVSMHNSIQLIYLFLSIDFVDPSAMIPNQRLLSLINQSIDWQKRSCLYHNPKQDTEFSLFADHICDK